MAKKKQKKQQRSTYRNAAPSVPRARVVRAPSAPRNHPEEETPMQRLAYTAAGAAGTALVGAFLARQKWQPKTIAGVLTAVGTAVAWTGKTPMLQSLGAGTMAAGGGQLALQVIDDQAAHKEGPPGRKLANAYGPPPGSVEAAFEVARRQRAMTADDYTGDFS